jgi:hypothetical protein
VLAVLRLTFTLLWFLPGAGPHVSPAQNHVRPLAEFEIAPDGDFVLVPLIINHREYPFLVCTGIATTIIDAKLRDELQLPPVASRHGQNRRYQLHARLGEFDLRFLDGVEAGDYAAMRAGLDLDIYGELGMDVLGGKIMQIDFDEGILRFLPFVPSGSGQAIKVFQKRKQSAIPILSLALPGEKAESFVVATGRVGNSLDIDNRLLKELERSGTATVLSKEPGVGRNGKMSSQAVQLEEIQIGDFRNKMIIANSGEKKCVRLSYLSRYLVTFDFRRGFVYLKKGAQFDIPDAKLDLTEVAVARQGQSVIVTAVNPCGPAAGLGLHSGDRLDVLNGRRTSRMSTWQIRRVLGRDDLRLTAEIVRAGEVVTLESEAQPLAER